MSVKTKPRKVATNESSRNFSAKCCKICTRMSMYAKDYYGKRNKTDSK